MFGLLPCDPGAQRSLRATDRGFRLSPRREWGAATPPPAAGALGRSPQEPGPPVSPPPPWKPPEPAFTSCR